MAIEPTGTPPLAGEGQIAQQATPAIAPDASSDTVPATGRRQAFRDIRRELQEADLRSPGVQKLILDELERADAECEELRGYVDRFHEADKRAAVLQERLKSETAIEILFGTGLAVGAAILGLAPSFWDKSPHGPEALGVGSILIIVSVVARVVRR